MKNTQFMVLGLGRFGSSIARELYENGMDVLAVDINEEPVDEIHDSVTQAVQADITDPDALAQLGVKDFDVAVVTIGSDIKSSSVATMLLKDMGVPMIVAKAQDEMHGRMLKRLGADRVIFPERDMGRRLAHSLMSGNILDYIEVSDNYSLVEITPPASWSGRTLGELDLRRKPGINVIAIRSGDDVRVALDASTVIRRDDLLLVVGDQEAFRRLERMS